MISLKMARFLKGVSQMELRKRTNIHNATLSYIERGLLPARKDQKKKIEEALGMRGVIDWVKMEK